MYHLKNKLHVVILGAGANVAAMPNGDRYEKNIYEMLHERARKE